MRAVVDTNVVVSRTISATGAAAEVLRRWRQEQFELVVSTPILDEYERALGYDRIQARHQLTAEEIREVVTQFRRFALVVEPEHVPEVIQDDPDDNKFLACAETGGADFIISRDEHLLRLRVYKGIQILSPAAFLAFLNTQL